MDWIDDITHHGIFAITADILVHNEITFVVWIALGGISVLHIYKHRKNRETSK